MGYVPAYDVATAYAALGDTSAALDWLERAQEMTFVQLDPAFDGLRANPRFRQIVKRFPTRMRALFRTQPDQPAATCPP